MYVIQISPLSLVRIFPMAVKVKSTDDVLGTLRDYKVAEGRFKLHWTEN